MLIYLLNLDDAHERRRWMMAQFESLGLDAHRIGVDMRRKDPGQRVAWLDTHLPGIRFDEQEISGAEMGCWASHLSAWWKLSRNTHATCAAVFEDDVRLDPMICEALASLNGDTSHDIVFLGTSSRNISTRKQTRIGKYAIHRPVGQIYNTWGYVISRSLAERFFAARPWNIDCPVDHFTGKNRRGFTKRIGVLRPAMVVEEPELGEYSQIAPFTDRPDRWPTVERARRRVLASRVSDLYYKLYRWL